MVTELPNTVFPQQPNFGIHFLMHCGKPSIVWGGSLHGDHNLVPSLTMV